MNLNQLGLVVYRGALVASVLSVAVALLKLGNQLKAPIKVRTEVLGSVEIGSVDISAMPTLDVGTFPDIDFATNAFIGAGTLEVKVPDTVDMHIER
jgi:hypothetical protein